MYDIHQIRREKLRRRLEEQSFARVLEASNGISGLIVEKAHVKGKSYDAIWISSLCDSAFRGKPDNESVTFEERLVTIREIINVTSLPVIFDGDTGGNADTFAQRVEILEESGVSAVIIEDKKGIKHNSLCDDHSVHVLEEAEVFAEKIRNGKMVCKTKDFMIFARIESFIAGKGLDEALFRARCYVQAGADGIMIHSYRSDGEEVLSFLKSFREIYPKVWVIVVPTTYDSLNESLLRENGANIIIYANHLLRSAYKAMLATANKILEDECAKGAGEEYCVSVSEILEAVKED